MAFRQQGTGAVNSRAMQAEKRVSEPGTARLHLAQPESTIRNALILAAGRGSRLGGPDPKPLHRLLGLPLLARVLLNLEVAGVTDAYVVLGYRGDDIRRGIEALGKLKLRLHWIRNEEWERPNGLSVLAAEQDLDGPFFLTMSDHLFAPAALDKLLASAGDLTGVNLLVDRDLDRIADIEEATKVRLDADQIADIGKSLTDFDAIDTGLFLATPALFDAIRASVANGDETLSHGVERLARDGLARAVDADGVRWDDVDSPADAVRAEHKLLADLGKEQDGPIARLINRRISAQITRRIVGTSLTPNQVSIGALGIGLASAAFAAVGGFWPWLAAGFLFQLASIVDGVDGELASLTFQTSRLGEWVDTTCDNIAYLAFFIGLTVGASRMGLGSLFVWGGVASVVGLFLSLVNINVYMLREQKSGSARSIQYGYQQDRGEEPGLWTRVLRMLHTFGKRDMFAFALFLFALAGLLPLALPVFGLAATFLLLPATARATFGVIQKTRQVRIA